MAFARWESVSEQQAQNLQAAHKELLHSLQGGDPACETGGYLDKDFKLIHANAGQSGEITLSAPPQNAIGSVHTHPSGELFSLEDVFNFTTRGELNIMTVVGNNGAVYVLEKTDTFDFAGLGRFLQGKLDQQKADFRTSPDLYINFMEDFLHEAERYGLGYWRFGAR